MAIYNNPFISPIMQAVEMMARQTLREQSEYRRAILYQKRLDEQQQREEQKLTQNRKFNYVMNQVRNPNLAPETQKQFADIGLKMIENPDVDISGIELKTKPEEPIYKLPENIAKYYGLPQEGYSLSDAVDIAGKYRDDIRQDRKKTESSGSKKDLILNRLKDLRTGARERYNKGTPFEAVDSYGQTIQKFKPIDEKVYSDYLQRIDNLIQKRVAGNWTEQDQKEYNRLKNFDVYLNENKGLKSAIEKAGGLPEPIPAHETKTDPLGLGEFLKEKKK